MSAEKLAEAAGHTADIRAGKVYLSAALCETYFKGIEAVIVLIRDGCVHVLPVHQMAAGGCLLKVRNVQGDRVASAPDVFLANKMDDLERKDVPARWSTEDGALILQIT
ncbi:MAG: hypothetical protein RIB80_01145 [Rhodospirillales bacterium]